MLETFTAKVFAQIGLDRYVSVPAALGEVYLGWTADGVTALRPAADPDEFERWYAQRFGRPVVPARERDRVAEGARARLAGDPAAEVPLDLRSCSPFELRVLRKAAEIGPGHARPYSWLAREIGAPGASRAVGNALGRNPVPLLIPCHRVVRSDFSLGGYAFGAEAKRRLLAAEGVDLTALRALT
jgi:O-6-methylguanine DNA methyltransferase